MNDRDPELHIYEDILAVYLIVNHGEFPMSPGKLAAQAFQAAQRLLAAANGGEATDEQLELLAEWQQHGTRTITKFATTRHLFDRCRAEIPGVTMIDEGLTEDTCGPTVYATWPVRRGQLPRCLAHKRISLAPK